MFNLRRASIALFLLAMSVLVLEVTLTRIFSVMSWHHFAYLIISLALLGFGAASSFLTVSKRFAGNEFDDRLVGRYSLAFCVATVVGFAAATKVRFYPLDAYMFGDYSNVFSLFLLYLIVGVPFFCAGVCIGYLISRAGEAINRLYFADLVGAGAGALLAIVGINYLGAEATIYAVGATAALVAVLYAFAGGGGWLRAGSMSSLVVCVLLIIAAQKRTLFPVYFPPEKIGREAMTPHYYKWHVVARVDVLEPEARWWSFGGALSRQYEGEFPEVMGIYQDGAAPTGIMRVPDGEVKKLPILEYYLQAAPFVIKPHSGRVLVIGVGGGIDVLLALYNDAKQVVGVELNPVIVEAVKVRFADFAGRIFDRPQVELITAEGRHYLTKTDRQFDVIQLSGVDTYSATSSGAYALSESYLYTIEAMGDYWDHLDDDGILSFSRWLFTPPRETLRLVAIQIEALKRLGIENPSSHFMILAAPMFKGKNLPPWAETLLKKTPFTREESAAYRAWAKRFDFEILYDPFEPQDNEFDKLLRALPDQRARMIGEYTYNIRPISDDDPFFFQFYRLKNLLHPQKSKGGYFIERVPLGIAILLVSLLQILVLAAGFIIGPLVPRSGQLREVPNKIRVLVYFGALGLAFISIEMVLLQKFTVFLGGPVYAMSVTLFAMLVFSGIGSLLAQRFRRSIPRSLLWILLLVVVLTGIMALFVNHAVPRLMFLAHPLRCMVAVLAVAPLAILMGMPFPTGLRVAQRLGSAIVPWAWGINAMATTLGAMLCVLGSMEFGFTAMLLAAGIVYLLALIALQPVAHRVCS